MLYFRSDMRNPKGVGGILTTGFHPLSNTHHSEADWWREAIKPSIRALQYPMGGNPLDEDYPQLQTCSGVNEKVAICISTRVGVTPAFPLTDTDTEIFIYVMELPDPVKIHLHDNGNMSLEGQENELVADVIDVHSLQVQQAHQFYSQSDPSIPNIDSAWIAWPLYAYEACARVIPASKILFAIKCERNPVSREKCDTLLNPYQGTSVSPMEAEYCFKEIIFNPACEEEYSKEAKSLVEEIEKSIEKKITYHTQGTYYGLAGTILPLPLQVSKAPAWQNKPGSFVVPPVSDNSQKVSTHNLKIGLTVEQLKVFLKNIDQLRRSECILILKSDLAGQNRHPGWLHRQEERSVLMDRIQRLEHTPLTRVENNSWLLLGDMGKDLPVSINGAKQNLGGNWQFGRDIKGRPAINYKDLYFAYDQTNDKLLCLTRDWGNPGSYKQAKYTEDQIVQLISQNENLAAKIVQRLNEDNLMPKVTTSKYNK